MGSSEESGKDWDELEEEARKGERIMAQLLILPFKKCRTICSSFAKMDNRS